MKRIRCVDKERIRVVSLVSREDSQDAEQEDARGKTVEGRVTTSLSDLRRRLCGSGLPLAGDAAPRSSYKPLGHILVEASYLMPLFVLQRTVSLCSVE